MAVYMDYNASTPVRGEVLEAMLPYLRSDFGNPSSVHDLGRRAREAIELARSQIAEVVGCRSSQVIFTSGGSEANNLFIKGVAGYLKPSQIAISAIEHPSVVKPAESLRRSGWLLRKMAVDANGELDLMDAENALSAPTGMVSVMLANNETGVILDVAKASALARSRGAWIHTDAVQALGKIPVDFSALDVHAMTLSAHKIHGPKGAGALIVDKRLSLLPLIEGGGQESGLRSGTENVAAIVGFGEAAMLAKSGIASLALHLEAMRKRLERELSGMGAVLFSGGGPCLQNTVYFSFPGMDGGTLVVEMDRAGFAIASGSACSSGETEPSATLIAMGVAPDLARGAVRVSLGRENTDSQIGCFLTALKATLDRLSGLKCID
ncbi:MAG: cysteine desulfurase [Burkholderiales bacterium]|nr:cysteine desulfurase [Burkholderiales bacterium]